MPDQQVLKLQLVMQVSASFASSRATLPAHLALTQASFHQQKKVVEVLGCM